MKRAHTHLIAGAAMALFGLSAGAQSPQPAVVVPAPAAAAAATPARQAMMQERMQQRMAQRQARLKQILQITPAQETAWNAWTASRQPRQFRADERAALAQLTTPERIDRMRQLRAARIAEMDRRGEATKQFYAALTPSQQKAFDALQAERGFGRRHHGGRGHHG